MFRILRLEISFNLAEIPLSAVPHPDELACEILREAVAFWPLPPHCKRPCLLNIAFDDRIQFRFGSVKLLRDVFDVADCVCLSLQSGTTHCKTQRRFRLNFAPQWQHFRLPVSQSQW